MNKDEVKNLMIQTLEKIKTKRADIVEIFAIILAVKVATYLLSYISFEILRNRVPDILDLWNRWDTPHYIDIAMNGYTSIGERQTLIVFFPLYPLLIRLFGVFAKDYNGYLFSSLVISNLASVLAAFYFYRLVSKDYTRDIGIRAVFYFLIFPTAYFLSAGYTESLFMFLTIASFYYAREDRWLLAGLFGGLASATRLTGIVLFPALIVEYWVQKKTRMSFKGLICSKEATFLLLIPLGFVAYIIINYATFGHPLVFVAMEKQYWFEGFTFPWNAFLSNLGDLILKGPSSGIMTGYAQIIFAALGLLTVIIGFVYLRLSYNIYALLTWFLATSAGNWISVPRYMLAMFPLFILLSLAGQRKEIDYFITVISITCFSLFLIIFAEGWCCTF